MKNIKIMISQAMNGKTEEEILKQREAIENYIEKTSKLPIITKMALKKAFDEKKNSKQDDKSNAKSDKGKE